MEGSVRAAPRGAPAAAAARLDLDAPMGRAAPDRLTVLCISYLLAPAVLFLGTWLATWAAMVAVPVALAAFGLTPGWRGAWPLGRAATIARLALGPLWTAATGTHHLVYSTADWQIRDAVLLDLTTGPWPVAYAIDGQAWLLRAPLGYGCCARRSATTCPPRRSGVSSASGWPRRRFGPGPGSGWR